MSRFHRLFSEGSENYAKFRPAYPAELYQKVLEYGSSGRELAVDVATGNGQAAKELARGFTHVVAIDSSPEQLAQSMSLPNVEFKVATAERFVEQASIEARSVDVVTVAQGLHWFDTDAFYTQCQIALRPQGAMAAWSYGLWSYRNNPAADDAMHELYRELGPYWQDPIRHIEGRYASLRPAAEQFGESTFFSLSSSLTLDMRRCVGYLSTWSAYRAFKAENEGGEDPLEILYDKTRQAMRLSDDETQFEVELPFFGILARDPQPLGKKSVV